MDIQFYTNWASVSVEIEVKVSEDFFCDFYCSKLIMIYILTCDNYVCDFAS